MPKDINSNDQGDFFEETFSPSFRPRTRPRTNSVTLGKKELVVFIINKNGEEILLDELSDLDCVTPLAGGAQGKVYDAKAMFWDEDDELQVRHCVLKHITNRRPSPNSPFGAHEKISELDETSTKNNTIKLIKVIQHAGEHYALLPHCGVFLDGAIQKLNLLSKTNPDLYKEIKTPLALHVLSDLCDAFISMHLDKNFVHGDVKPANVGFYRGHWCLIDMDCAKTVGQPVDRFSGTIAFSHPSAIHDRDNASNPSNDLFALGETIRMLTEKDYVLLSDRMLLDVKDTLYREALRAKYPTGVAAEPMSTLIQRAQTADEKISVIATCLTRPLATDQPDVLELKKCIEELKAAFFAETSATVIESKLEEFYESIKSEGYVNVNTASLSSARKSRSYRLSLCSSTSLFNTSSSTEGMSTENSSLRDSPGDGTELKK